MPFAEPTLDDLLSDPLAVSLMAADRVDPTRLRLDLQRVATRIGPLASQDARAARRIAVLLRDCVAIADKVARQEGRDDRKGDGRGEGRSLVAPGARPQW